jgi:hypothetical protein
MGWLTFCDDFVALERSKWASLIYRANFYTHAGRDQASDQTAGGCSSSAALSQANCSLLLKLGQTNWAL